MRCTALRALQTFPPTPYLTCSMQGTYTNIILKIYKIIISVSGNRLMWYPSFSGRSQYQVSVIKSITKIGQLSISSVPDNQHSSSSAEAAPHSVVPNQAREKWIKKRTAVKIRNGAANHRGNDVIVLEGRDQVRARRSGNFQINLI